MANFNVKLDDGRTLHIEADDADGARAVAENFLAGEQGQQQPSAPVTASGLTTALGSGVAKGAIGLAGLPGDIGSVVGKGARALADELGIAPDTTERLLSDYRTVARVVPVAGAFVGPGSDTIRQTVENTVGKLPEAQNTAEQYAQTIGEFVPNVAAGPGGVLRRAALGVVLPAIASETAGQLTKGTAAEPYARMAGALVGGAPGLRAPAIEVPTQQALEDAAAAGFNSARASGVELRPDAMKRLSSQIQNELFNRGLDDTLAADTHSILKRLETPPMPPVGSPPPVVTMSNMHTLRQTLNNAAKSPNGNERLAASIAREHLDNYITSIPQADVLAGDAAGASRDLQDAISNYAAAARSERITDALDRATNNAAVSGGSLADAARTQLKSMLNSRNGTRGLTPNEVAELQRIVQGSTALNALRTAGGLLGGGSNLHSLAAAAVAGHTLGLPGMAVPLAGRSLKALANRATLRQLARLDAMTRARSPLGSGGPMRQPSISPRTVALLTAASDGGRLQ